MSERAIIKRKRKCRVKRTQYVISSDTVLESPQTTYRKLFGTPALSVTTERYARRAA